MRGIWGDALLIMLTNIFLQPSIQYCSLEQVSHTTICPVYVDVCVGARVGHHVAGLYIVNASVRKYDFFFLKKIKKNSVLCVHVMASCLNWKIAVKESATFEKSFVGPPHEETGL